MSTGYFSVDERFNSVCWSGRHFERNVGTKSACCNTLLDDPPNRMPVKSKGFQESSTKTIISSISNM